MKATVVWSKTAQDQLSEIWLTSAHRAAVTAAANRIDRALAQDPLRDALRRRDGLLELEVAPLLIVFSWSEADRRIAVEDVMELGPLEP